LERNAHVNALGLAAVALAAILVVGKNLRAQADPQQFLNVSYDPTRELYREVNEVFVAKLARETGRSVTIGQSHGGSSRQSRAVIAGTPADVVTLALHSDIEALHKRGLIADGWSSRLPNGSLPYTSTVVFVVRRGNPRAIHDFADLVAPEVSIVTPNPKTSGNGKLSFLAAWGSVLDHGGTEEGARAFVTKLYEHAGIVDGGTREATMRFSQEKVGDVHLTWENEALLEVEESKGELEIVYPPASIRAEPYVAWVDANVTRKGTEALAKAYLEFLFTDQAQEIIAKHGYRPIVPSILERSRDRLPPIRLFAVTTIARDWEDAQRRFFDEDGVFDAIYKPRH
jgi:sulfate transport system substrate-binding protein